MNQRDDVANPDLERLPTGLPGLDRILGGGLFRGGVYMLLAAPGCGKTILGNQVAFHHGATGGRVAYVTLLAETHTRLFSSVQHFSFFDPAHVGNAITYLSAYQAHEEERLKGLLRTLKQIVQDQRATLLVVDGLVVGGHGDAGGDELKRFVHELQVFVELLGCTTLLLTNASPQADEYAVRTMIDGLIELRQVDVGMSEARTLEVSKFRGGSVLMGPHVFQITDAGIEVYPRFESHLGRSLGLAAPLTGPRAMTGFAALDEMLGRGLPAGSVTMLHGAAGVGKTLLGLSFLVEGVRRGQRGLYFGFFETPAELVAKSEGIGLPTRDLVDDGRLEIVWRPPFDLVADKLVYEILDTARARGAERVFIDGMRALHQNLTEPARARVFLAALANELRARGIIAVVAEEKHELADDDLPEYGFASSLDNIVSLQHVRRGDRLHKVVSVAKMRNAPQHRFVREFFIGPTGFRMARRATAAALTGAPVPRARSVMSWLRTLRGGSGPRNMGPRGR